METAALLEPEAALVDEGGCGGLVGDASVPVLPAARRPQYWPRLAAALVAACGLALGASVVLSASRRGLKFDARAAMLQELSQARPQAAKDAELERRAHAENSTRPLLTMKDIVNCTAGGSFCSEAGGLFSGDISSWGTGGQKSNWEHVQEFLESMKEGAGHVAWRSLFWVMQKFFSFIFPYLNFVQGFPQPGWWWKVTNAVNCFFGKSDPKWKPPVKGETMGVVSYQDYAKEHFGTSFPYDFFENYFTGNRIPSWEDKEYHDKAVAMLDAGIAFSRGLGIEPMELFHSTEPRAAFDNEALVSVGWTGFEYLQAEDIKYASNGIWGVALVEKLVERYGSVGGEVLGPLMTDSVFSVHLKRDGDLFVVDMSALDKYTPIPGFAALGGKAKFKEERGSLHMVRLEYNGVNYTDFSDKSVELDYKKSKRSGWRFAEGAIIASLLSMTNLILHVKDLHLELAAVFQAVSVDAFANDTEHTLRKVLDPFISRSVQATNDNFKLLFEYNAAEFSLAPLPVDEQLKVIDDFIRDQPLNLAEMDMEVFGEKHGMKAEYSTKEAVEDPERWGWRWHHRSLTVQRLYDDLLQCRLHQHYGQQGDETEINDPVVEQWWRDIVGHMPALKRATELNPEWASSKLTFGALKRVLRVLFVWLSWIHEDVGHSAASYVYNPVHTPMNIPDDGEGVPLRSYVFNTAAYRGFVFLERSVLMDAPPEFWFETQECSGFWLWRSCSTPADDPGLKCFKDFQGQLQVLSETDSSFSDCEKTGFYSCVNRVETAVSS